MHRERGRGHLAVLQRLSDEVNHVQLRLENDNLMSGRGCQRQSAFPGVY